jgi:hypothetical protein
MKFEKIAVERELLAILSHPSIVILENVFHGKFILLQYIYLFIDI